MGGLVSWRGANLTTDLYIGKVSVSVTTEEAKTAISSMGVDVIELEVVGRRDHYQSFRLRVKKSDLAALKDPDAWPEGIIVRRFFRGRSGGNNNHNSNNNNKTPIPTSNDGAAVSLAN